MNKETHWIDYNWIKWKNEEFGRQLDQLHKSGIVEKLSAKFKEKRKCTKTQITQNISGS